MEQDLAVLRIQMWPALSAHVELFANLLFGLHMCE